MQNQGCVHILESHGIYNSNFSGLESRGIRPRSWTVMENQLNGCLISDPCTCFQPFDLLFSIIMSCVTYSVLYGKPTCSISTQLSSPGKTWKMVLESPGKPLSVSVCTLKTINPTSPYWQGLYALGTCYLVLQTSVYFCLLFFQAHFNFRSALFTCGTKVKQRVICVAAVTVCSCYFGFLRDGRSAL